jgi:uncharacterized protein (DUF1697 family)
VHREAVSEPVATESKQYVALLRGINVGGKNLIKMAALVACFESHGFSDVSTYIQSGNVLFRSDHPDAAALTSRIEQLLSTAFDYPGTVTLRSHQELRAIVADVPEGFGSAPDLYRYDVIFLLPPLTPTAAMESVGLKEGVDQADAGRDVLYFSRLTERASQSRLSRVTSTPAYKRMTIRNWRTTTRLLELMESRT